MRFTLSILALALASAVHAQYAGFDKNTYPGDSALPALHKTFSFTGYWLNNPPGANANTWAGKRALVHRAGFGFLVLFNGRTDAQLKGQDAKALGTQDARDAVAAAKHEGFPAHVRIFLDMEEGGRMLPEQLDYIFAWVDAVRAAGMHAGVYCSGIDVPDGPGKTISTARDLVAQDAARHREAHPSHGTSSIPEKLMLWVANDQCPPAPGCIVTHYAPAMGVARELASHTIVWQYAQSPRRNEFSAACPKNADSDGNCYARDLPHSANTFIDLNASSSPDPSKGR